jgi:polyhydroxyalkanoate synthesis repressor PhaR
MRKIKKYANRKLYDTTDKQYISLERLSTLIKDGEAVEIIDNTTGEDITSSVVSQLLAREPRDKEEVPSSVLFDLLRKGGGTLSDYAKKYASLWKSAMTMAEDEVDKVVRALVRDKEISADEGACCEKRSAAISTAVESGSETRWTTASRTPWEP